MNRLIQAMRMKESENGTGDRSGEIDGALVRFLQKRYSELDESVLLAALLVSYSWRRGNVCLRLEEWAGRSLPAPEGETPVAVPELVPWIDTLRSSPVVGAPGAFTPLILDEHHRLYFHRLHSHEQRLAEQLLERSSRRVPGIDMDRLGEGIQRLFSSTGSDEQKMAAAMGVLNHLTVISGGPGTGKTTTVLRLLVLLLEQSADATIALAAPTGKAAARLKESIRSSAGSLDCHPEIRDAVPEQTVTLHRLLGARRDGSFRHHSGNPVPADTVIVDEASMIDQVMMSRLVDALLPGTRLILLGDKDQLASVEAGAVLGEICGRNRRRFSGEMIGHFQRIGLTVPEDWKEGEVAPLTDNIVFLTRSYRFTADSGIARFAAQVNRGEADAAIGTLESDDWPDVGLAQYEDASRYRDELGHWIDSWIGSVKKGMEPASAFDAFRRACILSPHRRGLMGVETLNSTMERILAERGQISGYQEWYTGRPVMITRNDHSLNLNNGDIGICLPDETGRQRVWFQKGGEVHGFSPARLSHCETAFAMTVHKSQGSEFEEVLLMLPRDTSPVLTRELIYTAVTRARSRFRVRGAPGILAEGIRSAIRRSSGLRDRLWPRLQNG